jgi:hypothetical protein
VFGACESTVWKEFFFEQQNNWGGWWWDFLIQNAIVGALIEKQVRTFLAFFMNSCRTHIAGLVFLYEIEMQDIKNQNFLAVLKVTGFDF